MLRGVLFADDRVFCTPFLSIFKCTYAYVSIVWFGFYDQNDDDARKRGHRLMMIAPADPPIASRSVYRCILRVDIYAV